MTAKPLTDAEHRATTSALDATWADPPGFYGWLATIDHKRIGRRYILTALVFFAMGGVLALIMRTQLAVPENDLVGPDSGT